MTKDSPYTTSNPQQIIKYLLTLMSNKCLIAVHPGNEAEAFLTVILELDQQNKRGFFDLGPDTEFNQRIVNSAFVLFTAEFHGISVAFKSANIKITSYKNNAVFEFPLPESMTWRERREYYRVRLPLSQVGECVILHKDQTSSRFNLYDISISGFAILLEMPGQETMPFWMPGNHFQQAHLSLPGANPIEVAFSICEIVAFNPEKVHKQAKVGCKLTKISSAGESTIQRYMQKIELERKQKTG